MRIRPAPVVALAALVALAGCQTVQERERPVLGTHPSCREPATHAPTRPFQEITVEDGSIVVEPDTVVQPPKAGVFGWMSTDYSWRITYTGEQSPISLDSIMRVGGGDATRESVRQAAYTSVSGEPGELVWAGVRAGAPCRYYKFEVEVWGGDLDDTLTADPGNLVVPY